MNWQQILLKELKERRDKLLSDIKELESEKNTLLADTKEITSNINALNDARKELENQIGRLTQEKQSLEENINKLKIYKENLKEELKSFDDKISANLSMIKKLDQEIQQRLNYKFIGRSDANKYIYLTEKDLKNATIIKKQDVLDWVNSGSIPKDIYKRISKDNTPLPKILYINYDEASFAWAQMHIRGLDPEDVKKYKDKKISFEELITGHSIHIDWRMKFKNSFVQWVITQDHIKDYFDTLIGRRDTKTGNVSKGLAIVKPSAEEPKKVIKNKDELIITKEDAKLIKEYVLLDKSYLIPPGDVGATAYKWAYMCTIWVGSVKAGMQREDAHEYFSYPANNLPDINKELFNGRFIIRAFKAGKDKRWWVWKAIDNPKPMDPIYHSCTGHYWPIPASKLEKFGRESYREESKRLYLKMIT